VEISGECRCFHRDTSIKQRLEHVEAQDAIARLEAAKDGSFAGSRVAAGLEDSPWLCPIEDRRGLDSTREGMAQGFSLGNYRGTGLQCHAGKSALSRAVHVEARCAAALRAYIQAHRALSREAIAGRVG